jgi:hypothetical protein
VPITDLTIKENDLVVATQGRAFWVLDDLSMVQQMQNNSAQKNVHLYNINPAYRYEGTQNLQVKNAGVNPTNGIVINYFLKNYTATDSVSIVLYDKNKKLIKSFNSLAKDEKDKLSVTKGMNQFVWNMEYAPAEKIEGMILWHGAVGGPKAAPGNYFVKVISTKDSAENNFEIKANPVYNTTQQAYEEQFDFLITVRDKFSDIQKAIKNIRLLRTQINDFTALQGKDIDKTIKQQADTINKQLTTIEEALYQTKAKSEQDVLNFPIRLNDKISGIYDYVVSGNTAPSKQVKETYEVLAGLANAQLQHLKTITEVDVKKLNELIIQKALPVIGVKKE